MNNYTIISMHANFENAIYVGNNNSGRTIEYKSKSEAIEKFLGEGGDLDNFFVMNRKHPVLDISETNDLKLDLIKKLKKLDIPYYNKEIFKIEVNTNPATGKKKPYEWEIKKHASNCVLIVDSGWAKTPDKAWKKASKRLKSLRV